MARFLGIGVTRVAVSIAKAAKETSLAREAESRVREAEARARDAEEKRRRENAEAYQAFAEATEQYEMARYKWAKRRGKAHRAGYLWILGAGAIVVSSVASLTPRFGEQIGYMAATLGCVDVLVLFTWAFMPPPGISRDPEPTPPNLESLIERYRLE